MDGYRRIELRRHADDSGAVAVEDRVVVEEPLEIRLDGHPVAVLMRTPGHDRELVTGFLISEGIIAGAAAVRTIRDDPGGNRILVFLEEGVEVDLGKMTRHMFAGSSCGICGKATLEAVFGEFPKLERVWRPDDKSLLGGPGKLCDGQRNFRLTGGLHAAGLFDSAGNLLVLREDIGRHNAVDKVIGHVVANGVDVSETWLLVSGRVSFEIMQKALAARIPCVAAISAPSSLAIDFAREAGQSLIGFLRPPSFNRYA